ncbi:MAG: hypothetical protein RR585_03125 [Coprobacillus sp.]
MRSNQILSDRGIVTISVLVSIMTVPLIKHFYELEYASRSLNLNYCGQYGGEIFIPLFCGVGTYCLIKLFSNKERQRHKYDL